MTTALVIGGEYYGRVPNDVPNGFNGHAKSVALRQQLFLAKTLSEQRELLGITRIIHTGVGAGALAKIWAIKAGVDHAHVPVEPAATKRGALRQRNEAMVALRPDIVIAFQGGRVTRDVIRIALAAGIEVLDLRGCK